MKWTQIRVTCPENKIETLAAIMSMLESSVQIEDYSDIFTEMKTVYGDLLDEKLLEADKTIASCSIYVQGGERVSECVSFINDRLAECEIRASVQTIETDDDDWANAWRKFYKPTKIGEKLVVVPSWEKYDKKDGEITVSMEPGMAFGTGTHETTRLCAGLLEKYVKSGDRMLDVGCGSGILAICASKLGATQCAACDIDPMAVRTAKENCVVNGCPDIDVYVSDLLKDVKLVDGAPFDIVCANIVADILITMSRDVENVLKRSGYIILSGIICKREDEVHKAFTDCGFVRCGAVYEKGWCALVYKRI